MQLLSRRQADDGSGRRWLLLLAVKIRPRMQSNKCFESQIALIALVLMHRRKDRSRLWLGIVMQLEASGHAGR